MTQAEQIDFQQLEDTLRRYSDDEFASWVKNNISFESVWNLVGQIYGYGDKDSFPEYDTPLARVMQTTIRLVIYHDEADKNDQVAFQSLFMEVIEKRGIRNPRN